MAEPAAHQLSGTTTTTTITSAAAETRPTVLMVDDEPSVLSALRRLFRSQGYRIERATSGRANPTKVASGGISRGLSA